MKRIFLTGAIGSGKSTLIRTVLGNRLVMAGGFVTERIFEGEELVGFDLVNPKVSIGKRSTPPSLAKRGWREKGGHLRVRFLTFEDGLLKRHNEAFSVVASALLREAVTKPFALIDEIGGFEILIPEFMEAFEIFLESQVPCVGVLKSLPSSVKLSRAAGLGSEYLIAAKALHLRLSSDPEIQIVEISGQADKYALHTLKQWKEHYLQMENERK